MKSEPALSLKKNRPYIFTERKDYYGWYQNDKGNWYYTIFVENGRVLDDEQVQLKSALLEVAKTGKAKFPVHNKSKYHYK